MADQILLLAGNSPKNKMWATRLAKTLSEQAPVYLHMYRHWKNGADEIDFQFELAQLDDYLKDHPGNYSIVAKSAGALLALQGVALGVLRPTALVCIGLPLTYAEHRDFSLQEFITDNKGPTLYIQADKDPVGSARKINTLVEGHGDFVVVPGNDHDYRDIGQLVSLTKEFFA